MTRRSVTSRDVVDHLGAGRDRRRLPRQAVPGARRRARRRSRGGAGQLGRDRRRPPRAGHGRPPDRHRDAPGGRGGRSTAADRTLRRDPGPARARSRARCCSRRTTSACARSTCTPRETLRRLLDLGVVPVVNENDTVADDEIRYGDNDRLAALVSHLVGADLLVLLTDTAGIFTADPRLDAGASLIEEIAEVDAALEAVAGGTGTARGSGGMATKLAAARIAAWSGVRAVIAAADTPDVVSAAIAGRPVGTVVRARAERLPSRKLWIAFARAASGRIVVDDGARRALCRDHRSLLPAGVLDVEGGFERRRRGGDRRRIRGPVRQGPRAVRLGRAGAGGRPPDLRAGGGAAPRGGPPGRSRRPPLTASGPITRPRGNSVPALAHRPRVRHTPTSRARRRPAGGESSYEGFDGRRGAGGR